MSVRPFAINQQSRLVATALLSAAASLAVSLPAQAQSVEEFYRKTPVQLLIGFPVANAYDTYGRAVARHLGKHIPGNPTVIPVNRPGAGSLTAANFLYNAAPKDGATIAHFNRSVALEPLMGNSRGEIRRPQVHLARQRRQRGQRLRRLAHRRGQDLERFADQGVRRRRGRPRRRHRRIPDRAEEPVRRQDQDHHRLSRRRRDVDRHGAARDRRPLRLVMERGQEQQAGMAQRQADQHPACSSGCRSRPTCPTSRSSSTRPPPTSSGRSCKLVFSRQEFAWPFAAPPDIPADRAQALRDAFAATLKDPEFLEDAKKIQIDVNPVSAAAVDRLIGELYASPEPILTKLRSVTSAQ